MSGNLSPSPSTRPGEFSTNDPNLYWINLSGVLLRDSSGVTSTKRSFLLFQVGFAILLSSSGYISLTSLFIWAFLLVWLYLLGEFSNYCCDAYPFLLVVGYFFDVVWGFFIFLEAPVGDFIYYFLDLLVFGLSIFLPMLSLDLLCYNRLPTSWMNIFFLPFRSPLLPFGLSYNWEIAWPLRDIFTVIGCLPETCYCGRAVLINVEFELFWSL